MRDLLDVVDDGEELPLGVHFASTAQGEAPHALVLQIGEDGFDGWHAPAVDGTPRRGIKHQRMRSVGACVRARDLDAPSRCSMTVIWRRRVRSG